MESLKSELHMHSTFSDGEFSPTDLVSIGKKNGVTYLALTDHDTFSGIDEFVRAAEKEKVTAIPGIEMTVKYRDGQLHLLGYFKDRESIRPELWDRVETMHQQREDRMRTLVERVNEVVPDRFRGSIEFENVRRVAEGVLARPHLAREMMRLGITKTVSEAFEKYLIPYNVLRENIHADEALGLMRASNGIPVVAHPGERTYSLCRLNKGAGYADVPEQVRELKAMGLMGLECMYPYHEKTGQVDYFLSLAEEFGLIATGSRDFHGFTTYQTADLLGSTKMDNSFYAKFQEAWG